MKILRILIFSFLVNQAVIAQHIHTQLEAYGRKSSTAVKFDYLPRLANYSDSMAVNSLKVCERAGRIVGLQTRLTSQFGGLITMPPVGNITDECTYIEVTIPDYIREIAVTYDYYGITGMKVM